MIEALAGYPDRVYRAIGHPVTWMGTLIARLDRRMNRDDASSRRRRRAGLQALCILLAATAVAALAIQGLLLAVPYLGVFLVAFVAASLPAQRSLSTHVGDVADALELQGLDAGRAAVSMIVGRNPEMLDEAGVSRAAIESLAENFSDGVVAPLFWMAVGGLPGAALYKAVNTADSMIGHRTARHADFGRASAKLDDWVNLPASRLSAAWILAAACVTPGCRPVAAWKAVRRDARKHRSPNAGWPEAAMAGALGLALAGPRHYGTELVRDAYMGDGRREAGPADIRKALRLYRAACVIQALALLALLLAVID